MKVCVFASSSDYIDSGHFDVASELGVLLAKVNIDVVFGGGGIGLMGKLADAVIENGGKITGVIPHFMKKAGWGHAGVTDMILTDDMSERKKTMFSLADAVIALPGGVGTLEELTEAITLKQLGLFNKPIIIINTLDFYKRLLAFFAEMVKGQFMREEHKKIWQVVSNADEALKYLADERSWKKEPVFVMTGKIASR